MSEAMSPMSSLLFPGQTEPFEVVDAEAREGVKQLTEDIDELKGGEPNQFLVTDANGKAAWRENPIVTDGLTETVATKKETITWDGTYGDKTYITVNNMNLYKVSDTVLSMENMRIATYNLAGSFVDNPDLHSEVNVSSIIQSDNGIAFDYLFVSGEAGSIETEFGTKNLPEAGTYFMSNATEYQRYISALTYGVEYGEVTSQKNVGLKMNSYGEDGLTKEISYISARGGMLYFGPEDDEKPVSQKWVFADTNSKRLFEFDSFEPLSYDALSQHFPCVIMVAIQADTGISLHSAVCVSKNSDDAYATVKIIDTNGDIAEYYTSEKIDK